MSNRYSDPLHSRGSRPTHGRDSGRDSGLGSSSGGRPDRRFTPADFEKQRNDLFAVQEALEHSKKDAQFYKEKVQDCKEELSTARKEARESEAHRRAQFDRIQNLEQDLAVLNQQVKDLQADRDNWKEHYIQLEASITTSNPMMPASDLPIRIKADHGQDDQRARLKTRMSPKDEAHPKSSTRKSSRNRSKGPPTKRNAYIEESPTSRPRSKKSSTPESHRSSRIYQPTSPSYPPADYDGDYRAHPLPSDLYGRH